MGAKAERCSLCLAIGNLRGVSRGRSLRVHLEGAGYLLGLATLARAL